MFAMFCNLLHNPQVRHLIALGADLDLPTCDEIEAFLRDGLEETELLGAPLRRVVGTARSSRSPRASTPAPARAPELPRARPAVHARAGGAAAGRRSTSCRVSADVAARVTVEIPVALPVDYAFLPSEVGGHHHAPRRGRAGTSSSRAR